MPPATRDEARDSTLDPTRPASLWPESTRFGGPSTLFPLSRFDPIADERRREQALAGAVLEVCRPSLALRVLLLAQAAALALALSAASSWDAWLRLQATSSLAAFAGSVAWLVLVCALGKRSLRGGWRRRAAVAGASGVVGAFAGLGVLAVLDHALAWPRVFGVLSLGGLAGLLLWAGLEARARLWRVEVSRRGGDAAGLLSPRLVAGALGAAQALAPTDPARSRELLADLGLLAQAALEDASGSVLLDDEVVLSRKLIGIETLRHGAHLAVTWELEPRALDARVPAGLLRVLLDHALTQGAESSAGLVRIWVRAARQRSDVSVTVSHQVPEGASIGGASLAELRERLRLQHDAHARIDAWQEADVFHARVTLPAG